MSNGCPEKALYKARKARRFTKQEMIKKSGIKQFWRPDPVKQVAASEPKLLIELLLLTIMWKIQDSR